MLSLRKAASVAGIGKSKLQRDAKTGLVSYELNEKKHYQFDEAELARAYPDTYKTDEQRKSETGRPATTKKDTNRQEGTRGNSSNDRLKLLLLEQELAHLKDKLESVNIERRNERERLEREAERLSDSLKAAERDRATTTKLLEDKSKQEPEKKAFANWFGLVR